MSTLSRACIAASMVLSVAGCRASINANARTSTTSGSEANASASSDANANGSAGNQDDDGRRGGSSASFRAQGSASGSLHVRGRGQGNASGRGNGQASGQGRGDDNNDGADPVTPPATRPERPRDVDYARSATAAPRVITYTAPPRPEIKPADTPPPFVGRVMPARRRAGRVRRPQVPPTVAETPTTPAPEPTTPTTEPTPPATTTPAPVTPEPVAEPTPPPPPAEPVPPPAAPPENVFGYEQPVRGCFEGQVYFIAPNSQRLPRNYNDLESSAALYACEWDIPTRAWEQGFPGLADRFEWFAIRYSGAFHVGKAGKYRFRLSSDDGAKVTIDGRVVIDNDGVHPPQTKSGEVKLSEGDHTMVIEYFQGPRYHINLQLFVTPPDAEEGIFSVR